MTHPHADLRRHEQSKAEAHVKRAGYASGGKVRESDEAQDRALVTKGVHAHERHDHPGTKLTDLKLRSGGHVKGERPKHRPDKMARGGKVRPAVNIIISNGGGEAERQMAFKQGAQVGTAVGGAQAARMMPPPAMPPRPPMVPPPGMPAGGAPSIPPPGAAMGAPGVPPGMPPRPPMKRGGAVNDIGGAGGAEGRLEKSGMEATVKVRAHERRKAGGRI